MKHSERGSVMMETVLVLPVLLVLIFVLVQVAFMLLAKQMTYYAAYCGARAALVYNPKDYAAADGGVVGASARTVLSWISQSVKGSEPVVVPAAGGDDYIVPRSDDIRNQVTVKIEEGKIAGEAEASEAIPAVTVTVSFDCPLLIPLGGVLVADMAGTGDTGDRYGWHTVRLTESCTLAKPYRTETFPLMPRGDYSIITGE